jgi:Fe-S cluster assembly protein SufD
MSLASALKTGDVAELPSRRQEDWRWSDLRGLIRTMPPTSAKLERSVPAGGPFGAVEAVEVTIANGRLNWWPEEDRGGIEVTLHEKPDLPHKAERLPMAALAARNASDPPVTTITFAEANAQPVQLRFVSKTTLTSHHARVGIFVKAGVSAVLLETYEGAGEGYFANHLLEIFIEDGGALERVVIVDEASDAVSISTADVSLSAGSRFSQTVLTSGAKRQRHETHVSNPGNGAEVRLDGVYLLEAGHADLTTEVVHVGLDGATRQLTKGAVRGASRAVFQGRIVVREGADRTDARMGHHALILSERAEVDAKPELEIYADDVACAHGNTVGALDEQALFYARSRGIPEPEARAMLTEAFVGEVVDRIEHGGAREVARAWVTAHLKGQP